MESILLGLGHQEVNSIVHSSWPEARKVQRL